jgi:hypothetical protein
MLLLSLVTGLFFPLLLLNQRWPPPLRLQVSHCSTFRIMCDVPSIAVFCRESVECFPGIAFRFFLKLYYYYYYYYYYPPSCSSFTAFRPFSGHGLPDLLPSAFYLHWFLLPVCTWSKYTAFCRLILRFLTGLYPSERPSITLLGIRKTFVKTMWPVRCGSLGINLLGATRDNKSFKFPPCTYCPHLFVCCFQNRKYSQNLKFLNRTVLRNFKFSQCNSNIVV